jgi:hypothetical protein
MTSFRQIEANQRNALRSTGPKTEDGKQRSRRNAVRHGLTAETVVVALEDVEDYHAFEAAIIADYDARTAVERKLVLRLASLLWRIRRASAIETDFLQIQAKIQRDRRFECATGEDAEQKPQSLVCSVLQQGIAPSLRRHLENSRRHDQQSDSIDHQWDPVTTSCDNPTAYRGA